MAEPSTNHGRKFLFVASAGKKPKEQSELTGVGKSTSSSDSIWATKIGTLDFLFQTPAVCLKSYQ
jgi:hypothetical protein